MDLKHRVTISVVRPGSIRDPVLKSGSLKLRSRLLNMILGEEVGLLVITPGDSVETVEIREVKKGGTEDGNNQTASECSI
ncbi:hypothetical protein [Caproicibacterium amylolyticum]|uniref:Uncharacterized protein n=1 Tax=Caproicibacterium amylolyticum TaxID=2766537 RepID=A0A7G9WGU6_9FIRM|nr:hypothetical protein [Caproicibacterium amylolyticum]QNO17908.1 hypothetical protein H6X83_13510 [Caproicibacterium amylolyticum]